MQPWFEDYQRRLAASVFGAPGQYGGLIDQPQPIPIEGTAGLSPLEIMARQGAMDAGPYQPGYDTATQLMGEATGGYRGSTGAFNPYTMISPYYNPYETDVVQDTLERMRRTSAKEDIAGRAQDISSGAFGGSRARLFAGERQAESERGILGALAGIRGQGFQRAQEAAMGDYGRRMSMLSGAAGGLGSIAGQVLGMGGQRQQELMSQLQMMNLLGGQGRDISQQGLSRLYQAALQKSQEPWERVMRGQALLAGLDPGRIYGGYTTESAKPEIKSEPTGLGEAIKTATGLKKLWDMFFGSEGGYVEKPKKYNDGGIINLAEGGLSAREQRIEEREERDVMRKEKEQAMSLFGEEGLIFDPTDPLDYALMGLSAVPVPGARVAAVGIKGLSKVANFILKHGREAASKVFYTDEIATAERAIAKKARQIADRQRFEMGKPAYTREEIARGAETIKTKARNRRIGELEPEHFLDEYPIEMPLKFEEGGIVSGLVPIHMQEGGDPEIPQWVLEALESDDIRAKIAAMQWLQANQAGEIGKGIGEFHRERFQRSRMQTMSDLFERIAAGDEEAKELMHQEREEMLEMFMPPIGGITSLLRTGLPKQILSQIAPRITARTSIPTTPTAPIVTPKGGVIKGPIREPVSQRPTSKAVRSPSRRPVGPYIPGGVQQVLREAKPPPSITQRAADVFKGKGTAARDILIGKPGQRNPFGKGQLGPYERFARAGKMATRAGAAFGIGTLGYVIVDLLSGLNDEEKAEMLAKLEGLTEEQMAAVAEEQERLKKVKDKKDRSRALSRFVDLMYERPTTIGDLGIMYQQERLGTVPAETVAAKEVEELARMSGLPVATVMMMQYPQGALFAREAAAKHQQIANAIVNYLIEQGVLDEVTAVERRATLLELPEESLEKIARELGVPIEHLVAPGSTVLEPD